LTFTGLARIFLGRVMDIYQIIDANINRLGEGLRVIEESLRFLYGDSEMTMRLKNIRTLVNSAVQSNELYMKLLDSRDTSLDPGSVPGFDAGNIGRNHDSDVMRASFKRCQESARVIEEYGKAAGIDTEVFKAIRFKIYDSEKEIMLKYFHKKPR
jgi:thiamine-phosphate pyrophosphorylase